MESKQPWREPYGNRAYASVNIIKIKISTAASGSSKTVPNILTADMYLSNAPNLRLQGA